MIDATRTIPTSVQGTETLRHGMYGRVQLYFMRKFYGIAVLHFLNIIYKTLDNYFL